MAVSLVSSQIHPSWSKVSGGNNQKSQGHTMQNLKLDMYLKT